jgi:hypothetical protein
MYELYCRNDRGLLIRDMPYLTYTLKAAQRTTRKYERLGLECQIRTAGRAIASQMVA